MAEPHWQADFAAFFEANVVRLRRTAWGICGDWGLAEDIVQAALIRVYPKYPKVRNGDPLAYTRRVIVNLCLSRYRKRGREVLASDVPEHPLVSDAMAAFDETAAVQSALASLPVQQRAVVALRFLDDLPVRDVAEILGISEGTVKSHTSRGLAALRTVMESGDAQAQEI